MLDINTPIFGTDKYVLDFWAWAYSDVLSNRNRSIFAEYIVALSLNVDKEPRIEWDSKDLVYQNIFIEVKSAAYIQSWSQVKPSKISFDISKKKGWDYKSNTSLTTEMRSSQIYIFCLYEPYSKDYNQLLNVSNWSFYLMKERDIEDTFGNAKTVSLSKLEKNAIKTSYCNIKKEIDSLIVQLIKKT